jgi:hypothetical protein
MTRIAPYLIAALALGLSACTNPYDPVQRGLGDGILGAASGAAIGAAAGGGPGAALGAAIGGATGIFGGVASTPPPPPGTYFGYPAYGYPGYGYPGYAQPGYGYPGYSGYPAYSGPPGYGYLLGTASLPLRGLRIAEHRDTLPTPDPRPLRRQAARDSPLTPVVRAMDIRARRPTPVPVTEIPWLVIPEFRFRRTGRREPSTLSAF